MLTDGEFREGTHCVSIGQFGNHHQIGSSVDVVMEIDLIGLIFVEPID